MTIPSEWAHVDPKTTEEIAERWIWDWFIADQFVPACSSPEVLRDALAVLLRQPAVIMAGTAELSESLNDGLLKIIRKVDKQIEGLSDD